MAEKLPARTLVTTVRMPKPGARSGPGVFGVAGDVVVDCAVVDELTGRRCGWHAMGPRADVRLAQIEHRRQFHSQQQVLTLINHPRQ